MQCDHQCNHYIVATVIIVIVSIVGISINIVIAINIVVVVTIIGISIDIVVIVNISVSLKLSSPPYSPS